MLPNIPRLQGETLMSITAFLPELLLCGAIVLMLFLRLFGRTHVGFLTLCFVLLALAFTICQGIGQVDVWGVGKVDFQAPRGTNSQQPIAIPIFNGLLVYDYFTVFLRGFLFTFTA